MKPNIPSGVSVTSTSNSITIRWNHVSGATQYNVNCIGDHKTTYTNSFTYTGLKANTRYDCNVRAQNSSGVSGWSQTIYITTQPAPVAPAEPTYIDATSTTNSVSISWRAVTNATSYELYIRGNGSTNYYTSYSANYTINNLKPGTTYYYAIRAYNSGSGMYSKYCKEYVAYTKTVAQTPVPASPVNIKVTATTTSSATITWSPSTYAAGYHIRYKRASDTSYTTLNVGNNTTRVLTGLSAGTKYNYSVCAYNSINQVGSYSQEWSFTTGTVASTPVPLPPVNIRTAKETANSIEISWNASSYAAGYRIRYKRASDTSYTIQNVGNYVSRVLTGLSAGVKYYYSICAYNSAGQYGAYSEEWSFTTKTVASTPVPVPPVNIRTANETANSTEISWNASSYAAGYRIKYKKAGASGYTTLTVGNVVSRVLTGLIAGSTYYYSICAYNSANQDGQYSQEWGFTTKTSTPVPASPTGIECTATTNNSASIIWNASTYATGYIIKYKISGGAYTALDVGNRNIKVLTGLMANSIYYYSICAYNSAKQNSEFSTEWRFATQSTTAPLKPAVPEMIEAIPSATSVKINWGKAERATGYEIIFKPFNGTEQTYTTSNTTITINNLTPQKSHQYKIRSVNSGAYSDYCAMRFVYTLAESVTPPVKTGKRISLVYTAAFGYVDYTDVELKKLATESNANEFLILSVMPMNYAQPGDQILRQSWVDTMPNAYFGTTNSAEINQIRLEMREEILKINDTHNYKDFINHSVSIAKKIISYNSNAKVWFTFPLPLENCGAGTSRYNYYYEEYIFKPAMAQMQSAGLWDKVAGFYFAEETVHNWYTRFDENSPSTYYNNETVKSMKYCSNLVRGNGKELLWIPYYTTAIRRKIGMVINRLDIFDYAIIQPSAIFNKGNTGMPKESLANVDLIKKCVDQQKCYDANGNVLGGSKSTTTKIGAEMEMDMSINTAPFNERYVYYRRRFKPLVGNHPVACYHDNPEQTMMTHVFNALKDLFD